MEAILRRHGLIAFMSAVALVSLVEGLVTGRTAGLAVAALMTAVSLEEAGRRGLLSARAWVEAVRWCCLAGVLAFILRSA